MFEDVEALHAAEEETEEMEEESGTEVPLPVDENLDPLDETTIVQERGAEAEALHDRLKKRPLII